MRASAAGRDPVLGTTWVRGGAVGRRRGWRVSCGLRRRRGRSRWGISFARALQKTAAATKAMHLIIRYALEWGIGGWSGNAIRRMGRRGWRECRGFPFQGPLRNATIYKGRSRDTAWYAMTDGDWRACAGRMSGGWRRGILMRAGGSGAVVGVDGGVEDFVRGVRGRVLGLHHPLSNLINVATWPAIVATCAIGCSSAASAGRLGSRLR